MPWATQLPASQAAGRVMCKLGSRMCAEVTTHFGHAFITGIVRLMQAK